MIWLTIVIVVLWPAWVQAQLVNVGLGLGLAAGPGGTAKTSSPPSLLGSVTLDAGGLLTSLTAQPVPQATPKATVSVGVSSAIAGGGATALLSGDPQIQSFDGSTYQFDGSSGAYYDAVSDKDHRVSLRLKPGVMFDHNGTYLEGVGMRAHEHSVVVSISPDDSLEVTMNNETVSMPAEANTLHKGLGAGKSGMDVYWHLFEPGLGNTVVINTEMLALRVFLTPAGLLDEGGVPQPSYLNFEARINSPPKHDLQGFIGKSYNNVRDTSTARRKLLLDSSMHGFQGSPEDYLLPSFFPAFP